MIDQKTWIGVHIVQRAHGVEPSIDAVLPGFGNEGPDKGLDEFNIDKKYQTD